MTLWWSSALIQMTSSDILGLGSQQDASWHALAHPGSGQDLCRWFELNVLCHLTALLPESDLAEHLLPSANSEYHHLPTSYNYTCHSVMIFGDLVLNLDVIMPHCLWEIYASSHFVCVTSNYTLAFLRTDRSYNVPALHPDRIRILNHSTSIWFLIINNVSNIVGLVSISSVDLIRLTIWDCVFIFGPQLVTLCTKNTLKTMLWHRDVIVVLMVGEIFKQLLNWIAVWVMPQDEASDFSFSATFTYAVKYPNIQHKLN